MPEDFYAALMMRRALPATTNLKAITAPGIYPVDAGNSSAPVTTAGLMLVLPPTTSPKIKFIASDWNVYTLTGGNWQGLGNSAIKDIVSSTSDTTAGRVLTVGWMGLGSVAGLNVTDANTPNYNCFFKMGAEGIHGPVANTPSNIFQFQYDTNAAQQIGYRAGVADAVMNHRSKINGVWGNWIQVFDTLHPPTAAQVGALASTGGRLTGDLEIYDAAPIVQLTETDTGAKFFLVVDASEFRLQEETTSGNRILSYARGSKVLSTIGQLIPGNYTNFDARYYTKTLADATFQPKGSYGKPSTYKISGNILWTQDTDTGVIEMTGEVGTTNGGARITFPYAFASKCYSVHLNSVANSGAGTALAYFNKDTTGFNLQIAGGGAVAFAWTARGI